VAALAFLITFRCYGTWLPGDERGYVDRRRNMRGHSMLGPNARLEAAMTRAMNHPAGVLEASARAAVGAAIREGCVREAWTLHALEVRTNHVHAVLSADVPPERAMVALKAWATRRLRREGLVGDNARPWSRHGSTRWLWTERAVHDACRYVLEGQGVQRSS
jgi:REP element-mobilizing transposase RayT